MNHKDTKNTKTHKGLVILCAFLSLWFNSSAQINAREDILLNNDWTYTTSIKPNLLLPPNVGDYFWGKIHLPHNFDAYDGYRRLVHGNKHGDIWYKKLIRLEQSGVNRRSFLFFEGVGSYAKVYLNGYLVGEHAGGRTTFTIDVTRHLKTNGTVNELLVCASHPANIKDLPWVCGGCSDERGFSEGSQPMGIFRPVHLIVTNDVRISPFGIHAWADIKEDNAELNISTSFKNYSLSKRHISITQQLLDAWGKVVRKITESRTVNAGDSVDVLIKNIRVSHPALWSDKLPYLYTIESFITENGKILDKESTPFGFRSINFKTASHQFLLNGKPVFINGIAEYEHLLGQSHAFSNEEIIARIKWIQSAGFNAFRDAHQPHNLLYGELCDQRGLLWWTQFSAHVWYDTKEFRENFKTLLREWVIERRNDPAVILWGLQNESKLPKDFAEECTALIRSLDPTASSQRLVTTCNGGEGTDWDVPQNWTGTYGGNPSDYANDLKKQVLIGEYGAWRTLDLHTEGGFAQNGPLSEDRMTQLMEQKIRLAESVKDSVAGQFFWLLTSHDNPGRVQGGEGLRELDRVGPVNYKGLLTPWEEPTDAYYMFRSNYTSGKTDPMVYIVSHTWPNRWMKPGIKDSITVYSNCDEVELFNDIDNASLGKQKRNGIGTHFQWDKADIQYNVLYAVGYVNGRVVAKDTITLFHLPESPNFNKLYSKTKTVSTTQPGYNYLYRVNCGGPDYKDVNGNLWAADKYYSSSWAKDFKDVPETFASQRRTFSPIKNTQDWKLFQTFRYGKDKLRYEFEVEDGEYVVELYFVEPWLGIGGGFNAEAMRLFDVAINRRTVLSDLDIWNEAGTNALLKKTLTVKTNDGKIIVSFPESKAGQALISAIAISKKYDPEKNRRATKRVGRGNFNSWLDIGDKLFANYSIQINSLPSNLFGADWVQLKTSKEKRFFSYDADTGTDLFIALRPENSNATILKAFENTNTQIITDENGGTYYNVYRKRFAKGDTIFINIDSNLIVCMQPANNMQPSYDLKPVTSYRTNVAIAGDGAVKDSLNGRLCAVIKSNKETTIQWPVQTGVADIYSITMKYYYPKQEPVKAKLQFLDAGGNRMLEETVQFSFTREGKWNQFTINTGSQINAGNYTVKLVAENGTDLAISGIEIQ